MGYRQNRRCETRWKTPRVPGFYEIFGLGSIVTSDEAFKVSTPKIGKDKESARQGVINDWCK